MKVLVLGGCGYIGAQLVPVLLSCGHKVDVLDNMWFGDGGLPKDNGALSVQWGDAHPGNIVFEKYEAVIHLACMTNNVMCELNPYLDYAKNRLQFANVVSFAKMRGVKRFIYASSVAAYGSSNDFATEEWRLRPTTLYGASKAYCEAKALAQQNDKFSVTIVRSASVVGTSMNMRFDTTMNKMTHEPLVITVEGGQQWRSHVAMPDLCEFYKMVLALPSERTRGIFNVVGENLMVGESASLVAEVTGAEIAYGGRTDQRSYKVSGEKAAEVLGFRPQYGLKRAVSDIHERLKAGYWKDSFGQNAHPKYQRMRYDLD